MTNRVTDAASRAGTYASEKVRGASDRTGETIESNPLAAVAAGLAVGAIVGALLPRSETERVLIGGVGTKMTGAARTALSAAKEAGRSALDEHGINRDAARAQVDRLIDAATKSAGAATGAATQAVRGSRQDG
jgi:hypothetical protein